MKFATWILFIALLIAFASAGIIPEEEYLPPLKEEEQVAAVEPVEESAALGEDGYRYKTVRKLRHRRDVSELLADDGYHYHVPKQAEPLLKVSETYLPPVEEVTEKKDIGEASQISNEYLPPPVHNETPKKETTVAPEISREYLPPTEAPATLDVPKFSANEELPSPSNDDAIVIEGPEESSVLADDGYHYRRIRYRRDVSEIAPKSDGYSYEVPVEVEEIKNAYIPPAEAKDALVESSGDQEIVKEYLPPVAEVKEASETAELADDGYRYKTIRKLKYRQRRDVSEIEASSPTEQEEPVSEISSQYLPPAAEVKDASEEPTETAQLAEDGYRYKTIRKLKYRHRRDVSEIIPKSATLEKDGYHYRIPEQTQLIPKISKEYLPPSEKLEEFPEEPSTAAPIVTECTSAASEITTASTEPETTSSSTTEASTTSTAPAISKEYLPPSEEVPLVKEAVEVSTTTAAPVVSNQYLPPAEEDAEVIEASEIPEETAVLADDGYHYKVGKRFRFRRDVSEIVDNKNGYAYEAPSETYLPPAIVKDTAESEEAPQVSNEYLPPVEELKNNAEIVEAPAESAVLADDGYQYKTVRRLKYRLRREAPETSNLSGYSYSTPVAEEESAALANDGYRYKTVRRLKYRHRRDVSELAAPLEESAILAKDGYHYKTPSTPLPKVANEYLPPVDDIALIKEALTLDPTIAPEVSNEYLPPSEATTAPVVSNEYLPPTEDLKGEAEKIALPQQSAVLADDGYRYKTVRRIRYRHRRDVSEITEPQADGYNYNAPIEVEPQEIQYLPPVEEIAQVKEATEADSATPANDGYRYKTVKRIRYRLRV